MTERHLLFQLTNISRVWAWANLHRRWSSPICLLIPSSAFLTSLSLIIHPERSLVRSPWSLLVQLKDTQIWMDLFSTGTVPREMVGFVMKPKTKWSLCIEMCDCVCDVESIIFLTSVISSDSDSDSELSVDEHSSSYASSHSSDSEDDDINVKPKWNNERQPVHSTPKGIWVVICTFILHKPEAHMLCISHRYLYVQTLDETTRAYKLTASFIFFLWLVDSVANHVKPYWPTEATTASDSEDPGGTERLRVETKVNVELHPENKLNHTGDRERDPQQERDKQMTGNARDTASPNQPNSNHQPEQRKGEKGE